MCTYAAGRGKLRLLWRPYAGRRRCALTISTKNIYRQISSWLGDPKLGQETADMAVCVCVLFFSLRTFEWSFRILAGFSPKCWKSHPSRGVLEKDKKSSITSPLITERNQRLNYQWASAQKPRMNNHSGLSFNPLRGLGKCSNTLICPACSERSQNPIRAVNVIFQHQTLTSTSRILSLRRGTRRQTLLKALSLLHLTTLDFYFESWLDFFSTANFL